MYDEAIELRYSVTPDGAAILFPSGVLATFDRNRQRSHQDKEAGGQLFAKFIGADTVIVEATGPSLLDRRSRTGFEPSRWSQQREIRRKRASGLHFVGDWHTHPESTPRPSNLDLQSMKESFLRSHHELRNFVLVVVGTSSGPGGLYVALVGPKVIRLACEHQSAKHSYIGAPSASVSVQTKSPQA